MKFILNLFAGTGAALLLSACVSTGDTRNLSVQLQNDDTSAVPLAVNIPRTGSTNDKVLRWSPELDGGILVTTKFDTKKNEPRKGFSFICDQDAKVYLTAPEAGMPDPGPDWKKVDVEFKTSVKNKFGTEFVFCRNVPAGERVVVPENSAQENKNFGIPFAAIVRKADAPHPREIPPVNNLTPGAKLDVMTPYVARTSDFGCLYKIPEELQGLPCVIPQLKDERRQTESSGYSFYLEKPATVYLLVHSFGDNVSPKNPWGQLKAPWERAYIRTYWEDPRGGWSNNIQFDRIYKANFPAGKVMIPANTSNIFIKEDTPSKDGRRTYGLPHMAVIRFP